MKRQKTNTIKEIIIGVVILLLAGVWIFYYLTSNIGEEAPSADLENNRLSAEERILIEESINSAPVKELTAGEKKSIEESINSAPVKELTPEERSAIEAMINQ